MGFTLMEFLLVIVIIGVLSVSLYETLTGGIRIWQRSHVLSAEEDIMIFFDKLSMDLYNAINFSLFEFEGGPKRVAFTTIVSVPFGNAEYGQVYAYIDQIGRVEYGFDEVKKVIYRRQAGYGQAVKGEFGGIEILVRSVNGLEFSYFRQSFGGLSSMKLDKDLLPASLGVEVTYGVSENQLNVLKRLINLPGSL